MKRNIAMPHDEMDVELDDLAADEICELISEAGFDLSLEQAQQLAGLVKEVGGIEEAIELLGQLTQQREAA